MVTYQDEISSAIVLLHVCLYHYSLLQWNIFRPLMSSVWKLLFKGMTHSSSFICTSMRNITPACHRFKIQFIIIALKSVYGLEQQVNGLSYALDVLGIHFSYLQRWAWKRFLLMNACNLQLLHCTFMLD
jgi:hypothetical protein